MAGSNNDLPCTKLGLQKGLVLAHVNICSLRNKCQEIECIIRDNCINIMAISETHLDESFSDSSICIDGFSVFRKDRNRYGGGVAIYVQNNVPTKLRVDLMEEDIEAICVQIHLPFLKPILVCCFYRPPSSNALYMTGLCELFDKISDVNLEIYCMGDSNIDWNVLSCTNRNKLFSMANACNLTQIVELPTRIGMGSDGTVSGTCIDHIFTNAPLQCTRAISAPVGFSDHNVIAVTRRTKIPKPKAKIILTRSYKNFNEAAFMDRISSVNWDMVCSVDDPEAALDLFMSKFMNIVDEYVPLKKFSVRNRSAPWLDHSLKTLMAERDLAKKASVHSGSRTDRQKYCSLRNQVTKLNRVKRKAYYKQRLFNSRHDSKQLWSVFNEIMGRKPTVCTPYVESNGLILTKPGDIANHFNDYYMRKISKLRQAMVFTENIKSNHCIRDCIMKDKESKFNFHRVDVTEVERLLHSLPDSKLAGLDYLDSKLLKITAGVIAHPVCHIFNRCLAIGLCPKSWKEAKVIPLPKDTKSVFNEVNSRPISILPVLSKMLEKLVHGQILEYFISNQLLTDSQHAYRAGHSTSTALVQMSDDWLKALDNSLMVGVVLLDFSAAFDVLDHSLLVEKLKYYGFNCLALKWITSYLSSRSQRVFLNGSLSNSRRLECGVPQGSCLGPLLFSIFTNDLAWATKCATTVLYADDTTLYVSGPSCNALNEVLSSELDVVHDWVVGNRLALNIPKTKCMVLGTSQKLSGGPKLNLKMSNMLVQQVETTKLLGVTVNSTLSWSGHIDSIVMKMGRAIGAVRKCCSIVSHTILRQIVQCLVLCHLDYCSNVWASAGSGERRKLQVVQNRAARLVLGCPKSMNVGRMHACLSWLSVENRLCFNTLMLLKTAMCRENPGFIHEQIVYRSAVHDHYTRSASNSQLVLPLPKHNSFKRTFIYRSVSLWNKLPCSLREYHTRSCFKKHLKLQLLFCDVL